MSEVVGAGLAVLVILASLGFAGFMIWDMRESGRARQRLADWDAMIQRQRDELASLLQRLRLRNDGSYSQDELDAMFRDHNNEQRIFLRVKE